MARRPNLHPTDAELEILQVLWNRGPTTLGKIHRDLSTQRTVAKTTVATILGIMLDKGLVRRSGGTRGYLWSPAISHTDAAAGMLKKLIDCVFDGSAQRMVAHLVEGERLSEQELEQLWRLLKQRRQEHKREKR